MTLTDKQKKLLWIAAGLLVVIHFAPGIWSNLRHAWASRDQASHTTKPSPAHPAPTVPPPTAPVAAPSSDAQFARLIGIWTGTAVMSNRDFCQVRLELRTSLDLPAGYTGYSSMSCGPLVALTGHTFTQKNLPPGFIPNMAPVSTVLSGPVEGGAIHLKLQQSVTTTPDGCQPTSYTLTPFAEGLGAKFDRGECQGGQLVMRRALR